MFKIADISVLMKTLDKFYWVNTLLIGGATSEYKRNRKYIRRINLIDNRFATLPIEYSYLQLSTLEYTVTSANCICHQVLSIARTWSACNIPFWIWKTNRIVGRFDRNQRASMRYPKRGIVNHVEANPFPACSQLFSVTIHGW